ncbi:MAG TPA: LamG domain-containing protein [Polyangia bacterium]|nr:LamG domain-containing protein [Polyangia bacterium]
MALLSAGCSAQRIVAVDPFPCGDAGASGCMELGDQLIGFWRLDETSGSSIAHDSSLNNNNGTLAAIDPASAWVADGPEGGALAPQGKGYVQVPDSESIDSITTAVTVAAWIYIDGAITDYATVISRQIAATYGQHYHLSIRADMKPALFITTPASMQVFIAGPTAVPLQTWVHIAGTYDGSMARLYLNGVDVIDAPVTGPFAAESNPVILSGNNNPSPTNLSERIPGRLDDVLLYRRALSGDEIARLSNGAL